MESSKEQANKSLAEKYIVEDSAAKFTDVAGLEEQKGFLKENIIVPSLFSEMFKGISIFDPTFFIYGPPGVGKTFLAKAIVGESKTTCLQICPSDVFSKFVGDGEKIIKEVFAYAKEKAPSIIILDEIDYLFSDQDNTGSEPPRRIRTELLIQISSLKSENRVWVVGVGNIPWVMNEAISKRFGRKIYIPLPDFSRRKELIQKYLSPGSISLQPEELEALAVESQGYSCSDILIFVRDAMMEPIRELQKATHFKAVDTLPNGKCVYSVCDPSDQEAKVMSFAELEPEQLKMRSIGFKDIECYLKKTRPSVSQHDVERYENYAQLQREN